MVTMRRQMNESENRRRSAWTCVFSALIALVLVTTLGTSTASATIVSDLDQPNSGLTSFLGPYATVDITLSGGGTIANFTVTGLSNYLLGDGGTDRKSVV